MPRILSIHRFAGVAGQFGYRVTVQYPGESPSDVSFVGSVYGGPVVMITESGTQTFVSDPGRFGVFSQDWVLAFFGETLDCGHHIPANPPGHVGGTGYAILTSPRTVNGRTVPANGRVCYPCADALQREDIRLGDTATLYLSQDGTRVTSWSGGTMGRVISGSVSKRYTPTGGRYERHYVRVRMFDGSAWHGNGPGDGMYVRLRRSR